eukprot:s1318_g3.t4
MAGSRRPQSRRAQQPQINAADASLQRPSCVSKSLSEMLAAGSLKQVFAPKRIEPRVRRTQYYEGEAWKEPEPVPEAKAAPGRAESASFAPKKQEVASIPQIPLNEIRGVLELVQSPGPGHPTEQRGVAFVSGKGKWQRLAEPGTPSHEAEPVSVRQDGNLEYLKAPSITKPQKLRSQGLAADSSKLQLRASGRARLRQVLLGRAAEDAVLDSEECQQVAMIRDRLKAGVSVADFMACEVADDALLQLQHLAAMPVDAVVLRQTGDEEYQALSAPASTLLQSDRLARVCVAFEDSPKICVAASPHRRKSCLSRRSSSCDGRASPTSIKKFSWSPQLCESDDFHQPRISRSGSSGALSVATSIASAQTLPCRQISGSLEEAETRLRRSRTSSSLVDHAKTVCMGGLRQGASRASHLGRGRYASEGHSVPSLLTGAATRSRSKTH